MDWFLSDIGFHHERVKEDTEERLKGYTGEKRKQKILAFHL